MSRRLTVTRESWPLARQFTISRGSKTTADVVVVTLEEAGARGRGECVPYPRYGETVEGVIEEIERQRPAIEAGAEGEDINSELPPGAARNALDCALWDLEAKKAGTPVWSLAGLPEPKPLVTAYTLSLDSPQAMAGEARANAHRALLKLKLGADGDEERVRAVREAVPGVRLIADANEGWRPETLERAFAACAEAGIELIEQPLPADDDEALASIARPVPVCADESGHGLADIDRLVGRYDAINIKLDKTGGLTEAILVAREARARGLSIMVGCMVATSLAMAPAMLVAQLADVVDLDGPLLLARDRDPAIRFDGSLMHPPLPELWG